MGTELAKYYVQIVPSAEGISGGLSSILDGEAASAGQSAGSILSSGISSGLGTAAQLGASAISGIVSVIGQATEAFISGVGSVAEYGNNIDKMSQKMGMSTESYQEWDAVMQHTGASMETMKSSMKKLVSAAETGSEAFDALGLSQEAIAQMDQEELFAATITGLQNMEDETQRTYIAGQLLGRGATELGALLNTSAEDTQAMRDRVHELGGVMSDEAIKAAAAYEDSLQDMQTAFQGVSRGILQEFMPSFTSVMDGLTELFSGDSEEGIGMITAGLQDMLNNIIEALPEVVEIITQLTVSLAQAFVESLPLIIESAGQIIATLGESLVTYAPDIWDSIVSVVQTIVQYLQENGPELLQQGWELLQQIADGLLQNAPAAIESIGSMVSDAVAYLMEHLPDFLQKGIEMLGELAQGIIDNGPTLIESIVSAVLDVIATIAEHLPDFLQKGIEMLGEVAAGLIQAIPDLLAKLPQLFTDIVGEITSYDWLSIGGDIITGIADGITGAAKNLASAAVDAVSNAWDAMTGWLDINSPSKKAKVVIGRNWALGVGEGFEEGLPKEDMTAALSATMSDMRGTVNRPMDFGKSNNADIIASIESLKGAILSMTISLDGDLTVGGIIERVDGRLGREALREAWQ